MTAAAKKAETSEAKHTPGPWRVEDIKSEGTHVYWRIACPTRSVAGVSVDVPLYGSASKSKKVQEEVTANARLIAAAPEMLEALHVLLDVSPEHNVGCASRRTDGRRKDADEHGFLPCGCPTAPAREAARAIIAKAEGR